MTDETLLPILFVEDEASDEMLLRRAFKRAEVQNPIVHLTSGGDALRYLTGEGEYANRGNHPLPALILLDLKLPGMTGLQILQWRKTETQIKQIPVVVLTSDENPNTIEAAYQLGANSYLVKPGSAVEVYLMIKTIQSDWIPLIKFHNLTTRVPLDTEK